MILRVTSLVFIQFLLGHFEQKLVMHLQEHLGLGAWRP